MDIKLKTPVTDTGLADEGSKPTVDDKPTVDPPSEPDNTGDKPEPSNEPNPTTEPKAVVIDDVEYTINNEGAAVDKDGKVFKTKEELEALEEEPNPDDEGKGKSTAEEDKDVSISDIEKLSGIEIVKEGKKQDYEFSLEGLAKREKDIKELGLAEGSQKAITEFFNSNPDLYKAYLYKNKKGTLDGFSNEPFYQTVKLDTDNEEQLFNFIVDAEVKKGSSPERAKSIAKFFKAENKLAEEGEQSYKFLVEQEKAEIDNFTNTEKEQQKQTVEKEIKFFGTYFDETGKEVVVNNEGSIYNKVVDKGSFGNFVIPQEGIKIKDKQGNVQTLNRREVYDYMSKPVTKEGYTQAQIDEMNRMGNTDAMLYQYMLNLTGNDVSQLIQRKILEEKGKALKKRLTTKPKASQSQTRPKTTDKKIITPV